MPTIMPNVLIVDDNDSHRSMLDTVLSSDGYRIGHSSSGEEALEAVEQIFYDLVLMDVKMGRMDGMETMKQMLSLHAALKIIIMTTYGSIYAAVDAIKSGAKDYITKPLDIKELKNLIKLHTNSDESVRADSKGEKNKKSGLNGIIGESTSLKAVFEMVHSIAPTDATALIIGESGTGKELIAEAIHAKSKRSHKPFIKVNCAAIPESLIESELFGHVKGAFTGAFKNKTGKFQMADTGTILLDEIAEMPFSVQAKILRVLQEQEFEPVGSSVTQKLDIRVISATNKTLENEILKKKFREDLFYRLNVVKIKVPPLRDRVKDIPLLSTFFLKKYAAMNRRQLTGFSVRVLDIFSRYRWPGNVRELENAVERSVILARSDTIRSKDLPASIISNGEADFEIAQIRPCLNTLKDMERIMILKTLEDLDGNRTHAADVLGISRRKLQMRLKEYFKLSKINP
ncbi:MAG: sigma-54 dependent transcriptional regulator [Desulfobacula sp.]|nr:sigma-54 dependent transcriptional regulator [Desulfobacula sp.]